MIKPSAALLLFLIINIDASLADNLDDYDPEFDFARHQKSTIENFPMQAIDQDALSEAAIEGALQVQSRGSQKAELSGRPIYKKVKEEDQKKQSEEVLSSSEKDIISSDDLLKFSQILPSQPQFILPTYEQPTGRTYDAHQTSTIERP